MTNCINRPAKLWILALFAAPLAVGGCKEREKLAPPTAPTQQVSHNSAEADAAEKELVKFIGKWEITDWQRDTGTYSAGVGYVYDFTPTGLTIDRKAQGPLKQRVVLDPKVSPAAIDLIAIDTFGAGLTSKGIYKFEGANTLTICLAPANDPGRPTEFKAVTFSKNNVITLVRKR